MRNDFYLKLAKALFALEIFTFLSWLCGYVEKRIDKKDFVNFRIYVNTDWTTNDCNTLIAQNRKR